MKLLIILAFKSTGLYPLDQNWRLNEQNQKLLNLRVSYNQNPQTDRFSALISLYKYGDHLKTLTHLNLESLPENN